MVSFKVAATISLIHILYYVYFLIISEVVKMGRIHNSPNKIIDKLRTEYGITIKTFQKNGKHYGFAGFRTIYLNENLFKKKKALLFTFFHEKFHVEHRHKAKILGARFLFSLVPLLLTVHWTIALFIYIAGAFLLDYQKDSYEEEANLYARKKIDAEA